MHKHEPNQSMIGRTAGLARYLSPLDAWAIAFGCIIGWGAFVMPGTTFLPIAGPLGTVIAILISAAIMLIIGSNYAYLMRVRPGTGGVYAYTREAFGKDHAFLCSWFLSLSYISIVFLNATALFVLSRTILGEMFHFGYHYNFAGVEVYLSEIVISAVVLLIVGVFFVLMKPLMQYIQTVLTIVLVLGVIVTAAVCLPRIGSFGELFSSAGRADMPTAVLGIVLLSPWAFVGFDVLSLETAHFKFKAAKSRLIIILSILCSAAVYIALSLVSVSSVPAGFASWQDYFAGVGSLSGVESVPTFFAAREAMGTAGIVVIGVTAAAAIFTCVIAAYRASARMLSSLADDKILSERFSRTTFSLVFVLVICVVLSFLGQNALEWFVELTTFGAVIGFGYTSASAYRIAKKEGNRRVMVTGIVGAVITLAFALVQLIPELLENAAMSSEAYILLALWCLLGFAFYWRAMRRSVLSEYNGAAISSSVLFGLLLYSALMWFLHNLIASAPTEELRRHYMTLSSIFFAIIAIGFGVMIYIRRLLRRRHEALEREKIRAEESNAAKSRFLYNVSHDIRTPMNAILGFTELAQKENTDPKIENYLEKIDVSGRSLMDLLNDILEMSRIENNVIELNPIPADIVAEIDRITCLFTTQTAQRKQEFIVDTSGVTHRYVLCDVKNFGRTVMNMIANACKFTPEGGTISVILSETADPADGRGYYNLRVKDTGIGMSAEFAEKVFTAFERERTSTVSGIQGTGLGMAIAKGIIDRMGGTIDVITAPGEGTEFDVRFSLELTDEDQLSPPEDTRGADPSDIAALGRLRLLLVEDNPINSEIASIILSENGFDFDVASDGSVAVEKVAEADPGYYDAVLMDIQMPVMDGYEAAAAIRSLPNPDRASVPIIAMTANVLSGEVEKALAADMQGYIPKPIDINQMLSTLVNVLKKDDRKNGEPYDQSS